MNLKPVLYALMALALMGCDTTLARITAIEEVEKACDLPANSLSRLAAEEPAHKGEVASAGSSKTEIRTVIFLGTNYGPAVIEKRPCILNFKSRNGYWFTIYGDQPTSI